MGVLCIFFALNASFYALFTDDTLVVPFNLQQGSENCNPILGRI